MTIRLEPVAMVARMAFLLFSKKSSTIITTGMITNNDNIFIALIFFYYYKYRANAAMVITPIMNTHTYS
jgi:hypothetical protein